MSCIETIVVTVANKLTLNISVGGAQTISTVIAERPVYSVVNNIGQLPFKWATMEIENLTDSISNPHFTATLGPLMLYKGAPIDWEELGIVQVKDAEGKYTGELDTSAYGQLKGKLKYQYR